MYKWVMKTHFKHLRLNIFVMIQKTFQSNGFWPLQSPFENSGVHWDSNSQNGSSLRSVKVHSLTPFCTPGSMRCDFWASLLACNLASLCLGCEPKVKVVIIMLGNLCYFVCNKFKIIMYTNGITSKSIKFYWHNLFQIVEIFLHVVKKIIKINYNTLNLKFLFALGINSL
jgi:hypothetical protein